MRKKYTIDDVIESCEHLGWTLLDSEYKNLKGKLHFICNKHKNEGVQQTNYKNILRGYGCKSCSIENNRKKRRMSEKEMKSITEMHGFIYCGFEYIDGHLHIQYKCKNHIEKGIQHMPTGQMKKSSGKCKYCFGRDRTHEEFVEMMDKINPNIRIIGEYTKTNKTILCECKIDGHKWSPKINNLLVGQGCPICAYKKTKLRCTKTTKQFKNEIKNILPNIEIVGEYINSHTDILCRCKKCGKSWYTTPTSLLNAKIGCPSCVNISTSERCKKTKQQFEHELHNVNKNILVLGDYINRNTSILCKCTIHNILFNSKPTSLLDGHTKCKYCATSISSGERILYNILDNMSIKYETQKRFKNCIDIITLPFDAYLTEYNIAIEYDGEGHYYQINRTKDMNKNKIEFQKVIEHDKIKTKYCKDNNIPLIRIPYWEKRNMEYFLFDKFKKLGILN